MDATYAAAQLANAQTEYNAARTGMDRVKKGSRRWFQLAEDVEFWGNKVANMEAALKSGIAR